MLSSFSSLRGLCLCACPGVWTSILKNNENSYIRPWWLVCRPPDESSVRRVNDLLTSDDEIPLSDAVYRHSKVEWLMLRLYSTTEMCILVWLGAQVQTCRFVTTFLHWRVCEHHERVNIPVLLYGSCLPADHVKNAQAKMPQNNWTMNNNDIYKFINAKGPVGH